MDTECMHAALLSKDLQILDWGHILVLVGRAPEVPWDEIFCHVSTSYLSKKKSFFLEVITAVCSL